MKPTKLPLYSGAAAGLLFWITTIICGSIHGNYNHLNGTISELGALGTRSQYVFSVFVLVIALLGILFFTGLFKACKEIGVSVIPTLPVVAHCLSLAGIAFFPQGTNFHPIAGQVSLLVILGPLLALILWRKKEFLTLQLVSLISLCLMIAALLLVLTDWAPPGFRQNYEGLIQRLFHAGWSFWFIGLSVDFIRRTPTVSSRHW
jgi:hypothetical membrane protein